MVVDSNEYSLNQLYDCLSKEFFNVLCLSDGNKALIEAKKEEPDFFILEIDISSLDGIDLCQNIRKFSESPILFLSTRSSDFDKVLALLLGKVTYFMLVYLK
ncbi:response regulator [Bacillaceae bacterium S4-13-58]